MSTSTKSFDQPAFLEQIKEEYDPKFQSLNDKAAEIGEQLSSTGLDEDTRKSLTEQVTKLDAQVNDLTAERDARLREEEFKSLTGRVESLAQALEAAREPHSDFSIGGTPIPQAGPDNPYADRSFFKDAKAVIQNNDPDAVERWKEAMGEGKAMTQGTGSTGGLLVPDQVSGELLEVREAQSVLRGLFSSIQVDSDTLRIAQVTQGLTAGWVAELAEKPVSDLAFGEISVNVFTKAGMAVASNQLLKNANRSVDQLIYRDLAKRLVALEEAAFIKGTGTGQPRGILNTSGIQTETVSTATQTAVLNGIVSAIGKVYTNYYGAPDAIVMHPRTWAYLVTGVDSAGQYIVTQPGDDKRGVSDAIPGFSSSPYYRGTLFGLPVYTSPHIPTNLGTGTNESTIIVGRFDEGLILDNQGITLDSSEHVYFTSNQTIFRAEDAVGFTAARYPSAFVSIGGTGLAGV